MTHFELVQRAIKWLKNTRRCSVVASETPSAAYFEVPDAIGWTRTCSVLIECKTSRCDFLRDQNKLSRRHPDGGVGNWRFYMAEPGLINPNELPEGWGLLEVYPRIVRRKVFAKRFKGGRIASMERPILVALLRRTQEKNVSGQEAK